jgi:hypothetical protein
MRHTSGTFSCLQEGEEMTGKDPFETGSGGSFRAFIFSSGVETLDIEAFRDDRKWHFEAFYEFIKCPAIYRSLL